MGLLGEIKNWSAQEGFESFKANFDVRTQDSPCQKEVLQMSNIVTAIWKADARTI